MSTSVAGGLAPSRMSSATLRGFLSWPWTFHGTRWRRTRLPMRHTSQTSQISFPLRTPRSTWWSPALCSNTSRMLSVLSTRCNGSSGPAERPYTSYLAATHYLPSWLVRCRSGSPRACYTRVFQTHVALWNLTSITIAAIPPPLNGFFVMLASRTWRSNVPGIRRRTFTRLFLSFSWYLSISVLRRLYN